MSLRIHIRNGENKSSTIEMDNAMKDERMKALDVFAAALGVTVPAPPQPFFMREEAATLAPPAPVVDLAAKKQEEIKKHQAIVNTRDVVMDEVVDSIREEPPVPEHYKTGIKVKGDKPAYKTRYVCPKCLHTGVYYLWEGTEFCDCHACTSTMVVRKAGPTRAMTRDKAGNFFVAGDMMPVAGVMYGQSNKDVKPDKSLFDKSSNHNF